MTKLVWGATGTRFFEAGLDRGVFFLASNPGVPWNGLVSVSESSEGGQARPFYLDGIKQLNLSAYEEFKATIESFFPPAGFDICDGSFAVSNGLFATQQPRSPFSMSYRTLLGNDTDGPSHAYKIHLVYNALAAPSELTRNTIDDAADPSVFSWEISTKPPMVSGIRPTSHFVVDSRYADSEALADLEDIIYGSVSTASRLPTPEELIDLFSE